MRRGLAVGPLLLAIGCSGGVDAALDDAGVEQCVRDAGADPAGLRERAEDDDLAVWSEPGVFRCVVSELDRDDLQAALDRPFGQSQGDDDPLAVTRSRQAAVRQLARDGAEADGEAEAVALLGRMIAAYPDDANEVVLAVIGSLGVVEGVDGEIPGYRAYLRRTDQRDEPFALTRYEDEVIAEGTEPLRTRLSDLQDDISAAADEARGD